MTIKMTVTINASAREVYDLLMSSAGFGEMCGGAPAEISQDEGGAVSLFNGAIAARQLELNAPNRIVQAWRSTNWPEGIHSVIRFEMADAGPKKTSIDFEQAGHPIADEAHLVEGWQKMYWGPMNAYFDAKK